MMDSLYIAGEWRRGTRDARAVRNPADRSVVGEISYGGADDTVAAADDLLAERADRIGALLARETGERQPEAVAEIGLSAEFFRWFGHEIRQPHGQVLTSEVPLSEAEQGGANRLTREHPVPGAGSYLAPSPWENAPASAELGCSEVFGPAAGLFRFDTDDEAITRANQTDMGLAGYVFTQDASRAWRYIERLGVGVVGCNSPVPASVLAPMGGVKQSGLGREGGSLGLEEFQVTRYASWQLL